MSDGGSTFKGVYGVPALKLSNASAAPSSSGRSAMLTVSASAWFSGSVSSS